MVRTVLRRLFTRTRSRGFLIKLVSTFQIYSH